MTNSFQDTFRWVQELQSASMLRHNGDIWSEEGEPAAGWGEPGSYSTDMSLGDSTRRLEEVACIGGWPCSDSDSPSSFFNRIKYNDSSLSLKSLMSLSVSRSNGLLKSKHSACIEKPSMNQLMSLSMTSNNLKRCEPMDSMFCLDDELLNNLDPRDDADRGLVRSRTSFFKNQIMISEAEIRALKQGVVDEVERCSDTSLSVGESADNDAVMSDASVEQEAVEDDWIKV